MHAAEFDALPSVALDERVHRLSVLPDRLRALQDLGLDADDTREALQFLTGPRSKSELEEFLDYPFRRSLLYKGARSRFSDASLLAFYSALEEETAVAEAAPRDGYSY
jgi:hypothetical protein